MDPGAASPCTSSAASRSSTASRNAAGGVPHRHRGTARELRHRRLRARARPSAGRPALGGRAGRLPRRRQSRGRRLQLVPAFRSTAAACCGRRSGRGAGGWSPHPRVGADRLGGRAAIIAVGTCARLPATCAGLWFALIGSSSIRRRAPVCAAERPRAARRAAGGAAHEHRARACRSVGDVGPFPTTWSRRAIRRVRHSSRSRATGAAAWPWSTGACSSRRDPADLHDVVTADREHSCVRAA